MSNRFVNLINRVGDGLLRLGNANSYNVERPAKQGWHRPTIVEVEQDDTFDNYNDNNNVVVKTASVGPYTTSPSYYPAKEQAAKGVQQYQIQRPNQQNHNVPMMYPVRNPFTGQVFYQQITPHQQMIRPQAPNRPLPYQPVFNRIQNHQGSLKIEPNVNINTYPSSKFPNGQYWVNVGDMHGNAVKILHTLIKAGVLDMDPQAYAQFVKLYHSLPSSSDAMKVLVRNNIKKGPNANTGIRFLGDIFADRGNSDYISLLLFEQLNKHNVPVEITFSNHDHVFIQYKEGANVAPYINDPAAQFKSLSALHELLKSGQVSKEEFEHLYKVYSNNLKFLSYEERSDGTLVIYQHARPLDPVMYNEMADFMNLPFPYNPQTGTFNQADLKRVIDNINIAFSQYIANGMVHSMPQGRQDGPNFQDLIQTIAWGDRGHENNMTRLTQKYGAKGFSQNRDPKVLFTHGHEGENQVNDPRLLNLDANVGRPGLNNSNFLFAITPRNTTPAARPPSPLGPPTPPPSPTSALPGPRPTPAYNAAQQNNAPTANSQNQIIATAIKTLMPSAVGLTTRKADGYIQANCIKIHFNTTADAKQAEETLSKIIPSGFVKPSVNKDNLYLDRNGSNCLIVPVSNIPNLIRAAADRRQDPGLHRNGYMNAV